MWRKLRIFLLLILLAVVSLNLVLDDVRLKDWQEPVWVVVYPLNADDRSDTQNYISQLSQHDFVDIEQFFIREAKRFRLPIEKPIEVKLADQLYSLPPETPERASILESVIWSLRMRFWSWQNESWKGLEPDIRVYMLFHSPKVTTYLRHSLGLQKGLIGLVNAFADPEQQGQNNLIAAHELLHTIGATDKYDPKTTWPIWPGGYAEPTKVPLLPQSKAEIMGGRVQISPSIAVIPPSLEHVSIGAATAIEINWLSGER